MPHVLLLARSAEDAMHKETGNERLLSYRLLVGREKSGGVTVRSDLLPMSMMVMLGLAC